MQPTPLVNLKANTKGIDFNDLFSIPSRTRHRLLPIIKALSWAGAFGSAFIFAQTYALSLQGIQVNSALGEPLDAVVTVNAAPGEVLQASCMRTAPSAESGMPGIRGVQLSLSRKLSPGTLRLTTGRPVNEPMSELVVHIDCPGAPAVKRSFLIMLDPRGVMAANAQPATQNNSRVESPIAVERPRENRNPETSRPRANETSSSLISTTDNRIRVRSRQVTVFRGEPIDRGTDYVVATGDALSTIAARINGRDYGTVWSWAATIQGANPHAFINGNPNELIAGSALYIPQALAAGTAGLTVPRNAQATSTSTNVAQGETTSPGNGTVNRYDDRFSTRTGDANAASSVESNENPTPSEPSEPAVAVAPREAVAAGAIRAIQPVMVMATTFSGVSLERLRQRERGLIQAAPDNLPNFAGTDTSQATVANAQTPSGSPLPNENRTPLQPVVAPAERISTKSGGFSWLTLLGGVGLALSAFFAGWWVSRRRAEAEYEEQLDARINEERYRARVRSGRQDAIRAGIGSASAIEVTEGSNTTPAAEPVPAPAPADTITEDDLDEVISATLAEEEAEAQHDTSDLNVAPPLTDNEGPLIDPAELEVDYDGSHELADIDLELLERDYAAQTETNTGLEEIAAAGKGKSSTITESDLGLEFPEDTRLKRNAPIEFDTLEFDPREGKVDFDIGNQIEDEDLDKTDALGLDLEEAGASIDAHLEELKRAEEEHVTGSLDATSEVEMQDLEREIDDLIVDNLIEDEDGANITDPEEFYHLEASSIMNVGELDFEKGPDDETNILRFRQRNIRTGTDDSSGDDE